MPRPIASERSIPRPKRNRYRRPAQRPQVQLRERDARLIERIYEHDAVSGGAGLLLFLSESADPTRGACYYWKRLAPKLWRGGWISKLSPPTSRAMVGSEPDVFMVEGGLGQATADAGRPLDALDPVQAAGFRAIAAGDRERLLQFFVDRGWERQHVSTQLKLHSAQARALLTARNNLVEHSVQAATFCAYVRYGCARSQGRHTFGGFRGDGQVKIAVPHPTREERRLTREPDAAFTITTDGVTHGYLLESETGTTAKGRFLQKCQRYIRLYQRLSDGGEAKGAWERTVAQAAGWDTVPASVRIVLYCRGRAHTQLAQAVIAELVPGGTGMFLIVSDQQLHLRYPSPVLRKNLVVPGTDRTFLDYAATILTEPICGVVRGVQDGQPVVAYYPFLGG